MITRQRKNPEDFWREYEEKTGEKVLSRSLGQYVSGWEEFDLSVKIPIWGLIIATSGGFRFHHFPQTNWLSIITNIGQGDNPPEEKTIFIPRDNILSAVLHRGEAKWYKRIFFPDVPRLLIRYRGETGTEKELLLYAEYNSDGIAEALCPQK